MTNKCSNARFIEAARNCFEVEGELEIDDNAVVSRNDSHGDSNGAYVAAWVWVENADAKAIPPKQKR